MDVILNTLKALPSIAGSPLAILAYIVVIGVWLLSYLRTARFRLLIGQIKALPEADRRKILEAEMNTVIPQSITAADWLRSRRQLYLTIAYVLTLLAVVFLIAQAYLHRGEATIDDVKVKASEAFGLIGVAMAETAAGAGVDEFSRRADSTKHDFKFDLVLRNSLKPSGQPRVRRSILMRCDDRKRRWRDFQQSAQEFGRGPRRLRRTTRVTPPARRLSSSWAPNSKEWPDGSSGCGC